MTDAPLRVFGCRGKPEQIALLVARDLPGSDVKRRGRTYVVTATSKRGLLRAGRPELTVEIDAARFAGRGAGRERDLVRHDVVRTMRGPGLDTALALIPDVGIVVSFFPTDRDRVPPNDPVFSVARDVASRTGGFVLDLYNGRLLSTTGELWGSTERFVADGAPPVDPSVSRIGARLVGLVAVAARALTEYDGQDVEEARDGIVTWVQSVGTTGELEPFEEAMLLRPAGGMDEVEMAHGSWQIEGAAILAWALDLLDTVPGLDKAMDPTALSSVLRFPDADATRATLRSATRRHQAIIEAEAERHYALYWRLREFTATGEAIDLEELVRSGAAGGLEFDQIPLLEGDLAIGDRPIAEADRNAVDDTLTITGERLRALNWLRRGGPYSAVELTP